MIGRRAQERELHLRRRHALHGLLDGGDRHLLHLIEAEDVHGEGLGRRPTCRPEEVEQRSPHAPKPRASLAGPGPQRRRIWGGEACIGFRDAPDQRKELFLDLASASDMSGR